MKSWYALYTKPKHEELAAQMLRNAGIEVLSPKIRIKKYIRKKFAEVVEQLFPSYIFASFDVVTHGHMIKFTRGIRYIVGKDNPIVVPAAIIDAIRERMENEVVTPLPVEFREGDRVVIREGPFKDFYGIFERNVPGKERAMILLEALHYKLEIERRSIDRSES